MGHAKSTIVDTKLILYRLLFFCHGLVSVYLLYNETHRKEYWSLIIPLIFLLGEMAYTIGYRKGKEYTYVWPSGFFYIMTIIPIIWIIEMDIYDSRINVDDKVDRTVIDENVQNATANRDIGKKVCELGLILGLFIGRWLMPRGEMTRDQLSALLLAYVGNAADIIELFETFDEPKIIHEKNVTVAVIIVYTWAIFQFTLITAAAIKEKNMNDMGNSGSTTHRSSITRRISVMEIDMKQQYIEEIRTRKTSDMMRESRGRGKKKISVVQAPKFINAESSQQKDEKIEHRALHEEFFKILVTLLMQDGPFLTLRLYLLFRFDVSSDMHIFFTCKNAIVSILLVYRLCILTCRGETKDTDWRRMEEASSKLQNVQLATLSTHMEHEELGMIRVQ